jgi:protein TonB
MLVFSFGLHAGAALVSYEYGRFEPPRLLPVQSGRASISLRSSPGSMPKSPRTGATEVLTIAPPVDTPAKVEPPVEAPPPVELPKPDPEQKSVPTPKPRQLDITPYLPDMAKVAQAMGRIARSRAVETVVKEPPPKLEPTPAPAKESTPKPETKAPQSGRPGAADGANDPGSRPSQGSLGSQGANVDSMPGERAFNNAPPYPADALAARLEGRVTLRVSIDETGRVVEVRIYTSSGVESLDRSAVTTVRGWLFTPAKRGGVPVPFEFLKPIEFSIQGR